LKWRQQCAATDRLNEVSHGLVRQVRREHQNEKIYYLLVPSEIDYDKQDENSVPIFFYSSENLLVLNERMLLLATAIEQFASEISTR
jgi:hypothetical protein